MLELGFFIGSCGIGLGIFAAGAAYLMETHDVITANKQKRFLELCEKFEKEREELY